MLAIAITWLSLVSGLKLLQLSDESKALEFPSQQASPSVVQPTAGYCLASASEFTLSAWVKMDLPLIAPVDFLSVKSGNETIVSVTKEGNNMLSARVKLGSGEIAGIQVEGELPQEWELVTLAVSASNELTLCSAQWRGVPLCKSTTATGPSLAIQTQDTVVLLGAGPTGPSIQGQILDAKLLLGQAFDYLGVEDLVMAKTCANACGGNCWGPGSLSCNNHIQLVSEKPVSLLGGTKTWDSRSPILQAIKLEGAEGGFSAWIYDAGTGPATYFSAFSQASEHFSLSRSSANSLKVCIATSTTPTFCEESPARAVQPSKWTFVAGWVSLTAKPGPDLGASFMEHRTLNLCWGAWESAALECKSKPMVGTPGKWETVSTYQIGAFTGQIVSANLYKTGLNLATAQDQFLNQRCSAGCQTCSAPNLCSQCLPGYANERGLCYSSQCADVHLFHQQIVGVQAPMAHPVYVFDQFLKSTVTMVTRSGAPLGAVDWGQLELKSRSHRELGRVTVHEAVPNHAFSLKPGTAVSVNVTGAGVYTVYVVVSWPRQAIATSQSGADAVSFYSTSSENTSYMRAFHSVLTDSVYLQRSGETYGLVETAVLKQDMALVSTLSTELTSKSYQLEVGEMEQVKVSLIAYEGNMAMKLEPEGTGSLQLVLAQGTYTLSVYGQSAGRFELRTTSMKSVPAAEQTIPEVWWTPGTSLNSVHLSWRPMKWVDGQEVTGPVTYQLRTSPSLSISPQLVGESTSALVTLEDTSDIEILAVLTTQQGLLTVPYASISIPTIPSVPSGLGVALAAVAGLGLLVAYTLYRRKEEEEKQWEYQLLSKDF